MSEMLHFHDFEFNRNERQLEPEDRVTATYLVTNRCECVVLTSIEITHVDRTDVNDHVTLRCVPSTVKLPDPLAPNETRRVSVELITQGELPGRHALQVRASYACEPVAPSAVARLEFTVTAD